MLTIAVLTIAEVPEFNKNDVPTAETLLLCDLNQMSFVLSTTDLFPKVSSKYFKILLHEETCVTDVLRSNGNPVVASHKMAIDLYGWRKVRFLFLLLLKCLYSL